MASTRVPSIRDIILQREKDNVLVEEQFPLPRVFAECEKLLEEEDAASFVESGKRVSVKLKKKITSTLERFVMEVAMLCNMADVDFQEKKPMPWARIFHELMVCTQKLIASSTRTLLLGAAHIYKEAYLEKKASKRAMQSYAALSLHSWLDLHRLDVGNAIIGLTPSADMLKWFTEWVEGGKLKEELRVRAAAAAQKPPDTQALDPFGFPARRGDVVVARVDLTQKGAGDLRKRVQASTVLQGEASTDITTITIYGRVKDAVEFNHRTFLQVWVSPLEQSELAIPVTECAPVNQLVKHLNNVLVERSWGEDRLLMRRLIQDPFTHFKKQIAHEEMRVIEGLFGEKGVPREVMGLVERGEMMSFLHYNALEAVVALTISIDDLQAKAHEMDQWGKSQVEGLIKDLTGERDHAAQRLFMPTAAEDLDQINTISFAEQFKERVQRFSNRAQVEFLRMKTEKSKVLDGHMKNQLSRWWVSIIEVQCEMFLMPLGYDQSVCDADTYIDQPPTSISGVKKNLSLIQRIIDPKDNEFGEDKLVQELKEEVYPVIQEFIYKAQLVVCEELYGSVRTEDIAGLDLEKAEAYLGQHREELERSKVGEDAEEARRWYLAISGLIKDIEYLRVMKELEEEADLNQGSGKSSKLSLQNAVPVSGIVMGYFYRIENMLKTVLELWEHRSMSPNGQGEGEDGHLRMHGTESTGREEGGEEAEKRKKRKSLNMKKRMSMNMKMLPFQKLRGDIAHVEGTAVPEEHKVQPPPLVVEVVVEEERGREEEEEERGRDMKRGGGI
eukprot:TRINITY_DN13116_c0_g1_i2.p1 TRINITY_DN13116_c0_g1~~TRINITY_DN13116_c0_g1_i2.p1  ORF type:complete len:785 (-),score=260.34 TRINITY_DN13116_c0_g1_i2:8-2362(-)